MSKSSQYTASEILTILSARQLKDGQVVFAGVGIPLLAATLAQRLGCPGLTILFEGGVIGAFVEPGKLPPSTNDQRCTKRANMMCRVSGFRGPSRKSSSGRRAAPARTFLQARLL